MENVKVSTDLDFIAFIGLIVLFCNFDDSKFDLYDAICQFLMK